MNNTRSEDTRSEVNFLWFFWNNCFLNRIYPRRGLKRQGNYASIVICDRCEREIPFSEAKRYKYKPDKKIKKCFLCKDCYDTHLEEFKELKKKQLKQKLWSLSEERQIRFDEAIKSVEKFDDLMTNCRYGTCDILAAHHELLKDDPERLRTDFLVDLICNKDTKQKYSKLNKDRDDL